MDLDTETDGPDTQYMRKYLNDLEKVNNKGINVDLDTEVDGPYTKYLRRYLNDVE